MSRRAYLFVDESGNHSVTDCYIVTGCWCFSEYDDPGRILKPTTRKLAADIVGEDGELKGKDLGSSSLTALSQYLPDILYEDQTIDYYNLPWNNGYPLCFTLYDSDGDTGKAISERYLGEGSDKTTPQLLALASIVTPLLRYRPPDHARLDSRHVILDASTWERPSYTLKRILETIDWVPEIYFQPRKSHEVPGIQLADVAANVRRRYIKDQSCAPAASALGELRL